MNLSLIKSEFEQYVQHSAERTELLLELSEQYDRFGAHWDLTTADIPGMIQASLDQQHSFWSGGDYHPYESLLEYANYGPEMIRSAFKDLLDENKDLVGRIDRFQFHLSWLERNSQDPKHKKRPHYHTVSTVIQYLSMSYPDRYLLYDPKAFASFLDRVGAKKDPNTPPLERFFKVSRIVLKIITQHLENLTLESSLSEGFQKHPVILLSDFLGMAVEPRRK